MTGIKANSHKLSSIVLLFFVCLLQLPAINDLYNLQHKIYVQINIAKSNILTDAHMN